MVSRDGVYSPTIYWGQSKEKVFLKVDITEISMGPDIELKEDHLSFTAVGSGARGHNQYSFNLNFYQKVNPKASKYKVTGRAVEFELGKVSGVGRDVKAGGEIWPRLVEGSRRVPWIKTDFDRFQFEESDLSDNEDAMTADQNAMMDMMERELKEVEGSAVQDLKQLYLFMYNLFQWVGYCFVFGSICYRAAIHGFESRTETFVTVGPALMVCQFAAILEIIHPMLGWIKTDIYTPIVQVFGRGLILFGLISVEPRLQQIDAIWYLFIVWSAVELVRYPYYMLALTGRQWGFVTWLRYSVWIPLYPVGFIFEGVLMLTALPIFEETNKWSISLPNRLNCSFHFASFLRFYMVAFLVGMYFLMQRMYEQRKKKLMPSTATGRKFSSKKQSIKSKTS